MRMTLVATLSALVVAATPTVAQAASHTFGDQQGDVSSPNDVLRTTITNGTRIGVAIHHRDLRKDAVDIQFKVQTTGGGNNWTVYATFDGRTKTVYRNVNGTPQVKTCSGIQVSRSLSKDVSTLSVPRSCISNPTGKVRLRPRVQWNASGSKGDWSFNDNQHFSPYVAR